MAHKRLQIQALDHVLDEGMNRKRLTAAGSGARNLQKLPDDGADSLDFLLGPVQEFNPLVLGYLLMFEQFEIPGHDADGVADLVRDAGGQPPDRCELFGPNDFGLGPFQLGVGGLKRCHDVAQLFLVRRKPAHQPVQGRRQPLQLIVLLPDGEQQGIVFLVIFRPLGQAGERLEIELDDAIDADEDQNGDIDDDIGEQDLLRIPQGPVDALQRKHQAETGRRIFILPQRRCDHQVFMLHPEKPEGAADELNAFRTADQGLFGIDGRRVLDGATIQAEADPPLMAVHQHQAAGAGLVQRGPDPAPEIGNGGHIFPDGMLVQVAGDQAGNGLAFRNFSADQIALGCHRRDEVDRQHSQQQQQR